MAKFLKVVKIVLISLGVLVLGSYVVLYIVNNELAKQIMATVVDYANRPLPIVGVSATVLAVLIWKIFSSTIYGKKALAQMKEQYELEKAELKKEHEETKLKYTAIISAYEQEIDIMYDALIEVCNATPNKKIKAIGENLSSDISVVKEDLRHKFGEIVDSNVELLTQSKEEIVSTVLELVKKELVEKYGEEGQKAIDSIAKAKKI